MTEQYPSCPRQCGKTYELLENARADERRCMADLIISKLDRMSAHIRSHQLAPVEAAELLQSEIQRIEAELFS